MKREKVLVIRSASTNKLASMIIARLIVKAFLIRVRLLSFDLVNPSKDLPSNPQI